MAEDLTCAAIGNSFHIKTVAILLDYALASWGVKSLRGPQVICQAHTNEALKRFAQVKYEDDPEVEQRAGGEPSR